MDHEHLRGCWPFDEIDSVVVGVMADGKLEDHERKFILEFCNDFLSNSAHLILDKSINSESSEKGVCVVCPNIEFKQKLFCFTGQPTRGSKAEMAEITIKLGGIVIERMRRDVDFLVVGAEGNTCWAFSCYGRKVEEAMKLRKQGVPIQIVQEFDFWDAIEALS